MRHVRTSFLLAVCGLIVAGSGGPVRAQEVEKALEGIRPQAIRAHMRFLADDLLEGRRTATRGYDIAARYVAARFEELGLEPAGAGGGYFQPVPMLQMTTVDGESSLKLLRDGREVEMEAGADFLARARSEEASVTAPVVFAGFGVTAPELGYDDYAGLDVKGKIVAILMGSPSTFPSDQRAYYSDRTVQARNAAARGAVGLLGIYTPEREKRMSWESIRRHSHWPNSTWVDPEGKPGFSTLLPGAAVSLEGAKKLFAGTPHTLDEIYTAAEAGRPPTFELPLRASLRVVGRGKRVESPNVAAVLRGSDPRLRDEYVVLSAHLDHVGMEEQAEGDAIHNGAYDNASGIAVMLEVANAFTRLPAPRRSVLFLAVTGEEEGLNGSDYFARHPTVPIERIVANTNLDMFLMLYPLQDVVAFGAEHSSLDRVVREAAGRLGIEVSPDPFPEQVLFIRSDHYSFVQQGVPSIFLAVGLKSADPAVNARAVWGKWMQEVYHKPGDDMSQAIDFGSGVKFAKLNFLISWLVAQEEQPPSWKPGDFFGEKFGRPAVLRSGAP